MCDPESCSRSSSIFIRAPIRISPLAPDHRLTMTQNANKLAPVKYCRAGAIVVSVGRRNICRALAKHSAESSFPFRLRATAAASGTCRWNNIRLGFCLLSVGEFHYIVAFASSPVCRPGAKFFRPELRRSSRKVGQTIYLLFFGTGTGGEKLMKIQSATRFRFRSSKHFPAAAVRIVCHRNGCATGERKQRKTHSSGCDANAFNKKTGQTRKLNSVSVCELITDEITADGSCNGLAASGSERGRAARIFISIVMQQLKALWAPSFGGRVKNCY